MYIIDITNDTPDFPFMNHILENGGVPSGIGQLVRGIIGRHKPVGSGRSRCMWRSQNRFPVRGIDDLIMNHIYATAQRDIVPTDVIEDMRSKLDMSLKELDTDDESKKDIIIGSKKIFSTKKELEDGTVVEVHVSKKAFFENMTHKIDLDKMTETYLDHLVDLVPESHKIAKVVYHVMNKGATVVANEGEVKSFIDDITNRISDMTGEDTETILINSAADDTSEYKRILEDKKLDSRKFSKYPFDSRANAEKAITSQGVKLLCNPVTGNIEFEKLVEAVDNQDDIFLSRILDRVISRLTW